MSVVITTFFVFPNNLTVSRRHNKQLFSEMNSCVSSNEYENKSQTTLSRLSIIDSLAILIKRPLPEKSKTNIRFENLAVSQRGDLICSSDDHGNIFMFNFDKRSYWCLGTEQAICVIKFVTCQNKVSIGCETGLIKTLNLDSGKKCGVFSRHCLPIKQICYNEIGDLCLSICSNSCFLWDPFKYVVLFSFKTCPNVCLEKAQFIPWHEQFVSLTNDNLLSIWSSGTGNNIKRFYALDNPQFKVNTFIFNRDGAVMLIGGKSNKITVFFTRNWTLKKRYTISNEVKAIKHMEFIPINDDQEQSIVGVITDDSLVILYNLINSCVIIVRPTNDDYITCFHVNHSGQYFVGLMRSGAVGIFHNPLWKKPISNSINKVMDQDYKKLYNSMCKKISLTKSQMQNVVMVFGQFPDDVRTFLWQKALFLPINYLAYKTLCAKGIHCSLKNHLAYKFLPELLQFPVLRLASNLAHWTPLFSQIKCLPLMVLRFVKVFKNEPLLAFEVFVSVVVNHCQFWFTDFPLMPTTITRFLENIIKEFDLELWKHFNNFNIKLANFIWSIMQTLFAEILTERGWMAFWDNVIMNDTDFLTLSIAAFFISNRTLFLRCNTQNQFEPIIHKPLNVNVTLLVEKTKYLSNTLKSESMFEKYKPLIEGEVYQPF